jgi:small conductance mechanosensitive channel
LASAGIAGLAISLGAQNLIKDFIGGFMILIGDQYVVGDTIEVGSVSGQVERVTLRVTYIRDARGIQYLVPNGDIRTMANHNKAWACALVDVDIAYEQDPDHVASVLQSAADEFANNPDYSPSILDKPEVSEQFIKGDKAITLRVSIKTRPDKRIEFTRELQKLILQVCDRENISISFP